MGKLLIDSREKGEAVGVFNILWVVALSGLFVRQFVEISWACAIF